VLDDDPTGVQTVHEVAVLTTWSPEVIERELHSPSPVFFILTNSRSRSGPDAVALNRAVAASVLAASRAEDKDIVFMSRSDSTLRGHFPEETNVLASALDGVDGVIFCPAFIEGGRITIDATHYVRDEDGLTPVGETEFAQDATFGFESSFLPKWIEERSGGRMKAEEVMTISLADIRLGGPAHIASLLEDVTGGQVVVFDAVTYRDIEVACLGILRSEAQGKRFVYRCGASLVRVRAGIDERPLLSRVEMFGAGAPERARGLVIVGSHVRRTSDQLERLLAAPSTTGVEVRVPDLLRSDAARRAAVAAARAGVEHALRQGVTPVVFTSREVVSAADQPQLEIGIVVSGALIDSVRNLQERPDFFVAKGGITSSDIGTEALGVRRAIVIGQAKAGVPVWRLGPETRYEGVPYVVFPGNVGESTTLASLVTEMIG
nr:hydroxyacid dehydrogenase [Chloroflexia bacterium]